MMHNFVFSHTGPAGWAENVVCIKIGVKKNRYIFEIARPDNAFKM